MDMRGKSEKARKQMETKAAPYRFSSTNQPPPESKRVPKFKTFLKNAMIRNYKTFEKKLAEGNYLYWKLAVEQKYGKAKEIIETDNRVNLISNPILDILKQEETEDEDECQDDSQTNS